MKVKFLMFALVVAFAAAVNAQEVSEKEVKCENAAAGAKAEAKEAKKAKQTAKKIAKQNKEAEKMRENASKK